MLVLTWGVPGGRQPWKYHCFQTLDDLWGPFWVFFLTDFLEVDSSVQERKLRDVFVFLFGGVLMHSTSHLRVFSVVNVPPIFYVKSHGSFFC